jgi:tetratricopeptide (TPR) repeat protein
MRKLLVGLVALAATAGVAAADKPTKDQVAQAKKLYTAAEAEVRISKFAEAAKDYTSAYELTKDPALLFKIASAHQNAGACDSAVVYYRQYLKEAPAKSKFIALAKERITKCGAPVDEPVATQPPVTPVVTEKPVEPPPVVETKPEPPPVVDTKPAEPVPVVVTKPEPPPVTTKASDDDEPEGHSHDRAWTMLGAMALLEGAGATLYAQGAGTNSSGYKDAAYASFGLGGVAAIGAIYYFARHNPHGEPTSMVVPTADAHSAGVAGIFRF